MLMRRVGFLVRSISLSLTFLALACSEPTGRLQVVLVPEDSIPNGVDATPARDEGEPGISDGWSVRYDRFVVSMGQFSAARRARPSGKKIELPSVHVVDFVRAPASGLTIGTLEQVAAERWDRVGFAMPRATASAIRADFTSQSDYDAMVQGGLTLLVEGRLFTNEAACAAESRDRAQCKTFRFAVVAPTAFADCANEEGDAGFAIPTGGTQVVKPTVHGDHWFFTNITQGAEVTSRKAQWLADADEAGNQDGDITLDELRSLPAATAFPASAGYNLSGGFRGPIATAYDYLIEQASTLGDWNGDGECPTRSAL